MKALKVFLISLLVAALVLGAVGCGGGEDEATPTPGKTLAPGETPTPTLAPPTPPSMEPVTLRLAHGYTVGGVYDLEIQKWVELIEEYTDGLVTVDVYPAASLFASYDLWEAVTTGAVDLYIDSAYYMIRFVPDLVLWWTEGLWDSQEHGWAVKDDGRVFDALAEKIEASGPVEVLGWPEEITMNVISISKDKEMFSRFDERGQKFQKPPGASGSPSTELIGGTVIEIPYEELYIALAQGIVDGTVASIPRYMGLKLYELAPHALVSQLAAGSWVAMINRDTWDRFSPEVQDIIENQVMPELLAYSRVEIPAYMDEVIAFAEEVSETFHVSTPETHPEYYNGLRDTAMFKTMRLMVEPELLEIVDSYNPRLQP